MIKEFLFTLVLISLSPVCLPQESVRIISEAEADSIFGLPEFTLMLSVEFFSDLSRTSANKMRFGFDEQQLIITDQNGDVLFPESYQLIENAVLTVFEIKNIQELISLGESDTLSFEQRPGHLTISNNIYTLQYGTPCPPFCN